MAEKGVDALLTWIYPKAYVSSLAELDHKFFEKRNIKGLIFDLDNTIIAWRGTEFRPEVLAALTRFGDAGLRLCVVSNALGQRVSDLVEPLKIPYFSRARKPSRRAFDEAMVRMGTQPAETAVIGDQLFTDVLGGNRAGCFTVLVVPMTPRDFWATRVVRVVERFFLKKVVQKTPLIRVGQDNTNE